MRPITFARTRRVLAVGVLFLSVAVYGGCDGASPVQPAGVSLPSYGDTTGVPGDTTSVPGDTLHVPGDTTAIPGDTTGVPGDTTGIPGDTVGVPGDTLPGQRRSHLRVSVVAAADSGGIALVGGAVVSVSRGESGPEVARVTTTGGYAVLSVLPGLYVVRLESVPGGLQPAPGETGERRMIVSPGSNLDVRFLLEQ